MKIGILYVKGALPLFEDFGNLPTHTVNENGLVNGIKAHDALDGLILPGGSIMESESIGPDLKSEIRKMASDGAFILGMCSGFQLLANETDVGRKSPCPILREGLGILDVSFSPMISNDSVEAEIVSESFMTPGMVNEHITGFHCHTYGEIKGDASPLCYSMVRRTDYADNPRKILSGVRNDDGNVVGTMIHASLDENKALVRNILNFLDADDAVVQNILNDNKELVKKIRSEIGVNTNLFVRGNVNSINSTGNPQSINITGNPQSTDYESTDSAANPQSTSPVVNAQKTPKMIMIASTGSDSGKTFLTTGMVGVLRKKGYKTCVLKVGPDIRDIVPSLYLNKERMENFSSIKIGGLGWKDLKDVLEDIKAQNYDIILVEGVMSIFTGMLNEKTPFSSAEIARAGNVPVILVSPCNKGGIETAAVDIAAHTELMTKMGIKVKGAILNKVYDAGIAEIARNYITGKTGLNFIGLVPKIKIKERGNIPEVEMKLEEFCQNAMETVERYLNVDKIAKMAGNPEFSGYLSYEDMLKRFK